MHLLLPLLLVAAEALSDPPRLSCGPNTRRVVERMDGRLWRERCVDARGAIEGVEISYYENGRAASVARYHEGVRDGGSEYFFNDGRVWLREEWVHAELTSQWVLPAAGGLSPERRHDLQSGAVAAGCRRDRCGDDRRAASATPVRLGDGRKASGFLRDGKRTRRWSVRYPNGRLAMRAEYARGTFVGTFEEWHPDGRWRTIGSYAEGQRIRKWKARDAEGRLTEREHGEPWREVSCSEYLEIAQFLNAAGALSAGTKGVRADVAVLDLVSPSGVWFENVTDEPRVLLSRAMMARALRDAGGVHPRGNAPSPGSAPSRTLLAVGHPSRSAFITCVASMRGVVVQLGYFYQLTFGEMAGGLCVTHLTQLGGRPI